MSEHYDMIIVGTGIASSFFLLRHLERAPKNTRILVLEKGQYRTHQQMFREHRHSLVDVEDAYSNPTPNRYWAVNIVFGGNSNCWWACAPRLHPSDFRLRSLYGVGRDWPLSYEDLAPDYEFVESVMSISGPNDGSPYPRRTPHPQPPHLFTNPDRILKSAYPDLYFNQPTARARVATMHRPPCCATGVCHLCPGDVKFTVLNELSDIFRDRRVTLKNNSDVRLLEKTGNVITGVRFIEDGAEKLAQADLVVLGANAIFNPAIMLRSGLSHPVLGRCLSDHIEVMATVFLKGLDNFQGSTSITGHGYMLYDGEFRKHRGACLIQSYNIPRLRPEFGRWREVLQLKFTIEDIPSKKNHVRLPADPNGLPETIYRGHSSYVDGTIEHLRTNLSEILSPLPVERIVFNGQPMQRSIHILGTTRMGHDPKTNVIDDRMMHHQIRNLLVLGSGAFPTAPASHPTLTLAALANRAARLL